MKFISIRELRAGTKKLKAMLNKNDKLVLTSNGKPIALFTPVSEETFEEELAALRRARAMIALDRVRGDYLQKGPGPLSMDGIDKVISKSRRQRRKSRAQR